MEKYLYLEFFNENKKLHKETPFPKLKRDVIECWLTADYHKLEQESQKDYSRLETMRRKKSRRGIHFRNDIVPKRKR